MEEEWQTGWLLFEGVQRFLTCRERRVVGSTCRDLRARFLEARPDWKCVVLTESALLGPGQRGHLRSVVVREDGELDDVVGEMEVRDGVREGPSGGEKRARTRE
jgi:hypothetical protein